VRRRWTIGWLGGAAIGVANGALREASYGRRLGERRANQLSALSGALAFAAHFRALQRRWPLAGRGEALEVGAAWLAAGPEATRLTLRAPASSPPRTPRR
jgi:hypothetical protein